jgi:hypothetical protein
MLDQVLTCLCGRLEQALQAAHGRSEAWVALAGPAEPDGSTSEALRNRIAVGLVALQESAASAFNRPGSGEGRQMAAPPLRLDAVIVIAAHFTGADYPLGLEMLSRVIVFFHGNPVFSHSDTPDLPPAIERLSVQFANLSLSDTALLLPPAVRAMPFALYQVRGLHFEPAEDNRARSPIAVRTGP